MKDGRLAARETPKSSVICEMHKIRPEGAQTLSSQPYVSFQILKKTLWKSVSFIKDKMLRLAFKRGGASGGLYRVVGRIKISSRKDLPRYFWVPI